MQFDYVQHLGEIFKGEIVARLASNPSVLSALIIQMVGIQSGCIIPTDAYTNVKNMPPDIHRQMHKITKNGKSTFEIDDMIIKKIDGNVPIFDAFFHLCTMSTHCSVYGALIYLFSFFSLFELILRKKKALRKDERKAQPTVKKLKSI